MTAMGLVVAAVFAAAGGAAVEPHFSAPVVSSVGSTKWEAREMLAADLNGAGKPDLVMGSPGSSRLFIAIGKGDGSFHRPVAYRFDSPERLPYDVAVGDLNGDGWPDLTVVGANWTRTVIIVLINDGGGRFHRDRVYASPAIDGANLIAAGDVDGNGIVDVVVAGRPYGEVLFGDLAVLLGTGSGQLAAPRTVAGLGPWSDLAVGDFNADGRLDAALAAHSDHAVRVRLATGDGTFGSARRLGAFEGAAEAVTSADLNHDGILDLAVADDTGRVGLLLGNGDGTFAAQREYAMRSRGDAS